MIWDRNGLPTRTRRTPCRQCGAMIDCNDCWEYVRDWSPFSIWCCPNCRMAQATFNGGDKTRCYFCGWDERYDCGTSYLNEDGKWVSEPPEPEPPLRKDAP